MDVFEKALIRYKGLKGEDGPWVAFDEVVCMQNDKIVYQKSHPIEWHSQSINIGNAALQRYWSKLRAWPEPPLGALGLRFIFICIAFLY